MPVKSVATRRSSSKPDRDLPELSNAMLSRAVLKRAGKRVGRPPLANPKVSISLRLPAQALARWRASGVGWQTRMADILAKKAP